MTVYRAVASGTFTSGETWSFRQHFDSPAAISVVSADWSTNIQNFWTNATFGVETLYPTGTSLTETSVAALSGVPFREGLKQVAPQTLPGTGAGDSLPEQTCVLVSLRAAAVGRKNRGRIHLPALMETVVTGGEINSTESTRVSTAINALYDGMRIAGHTPVIYNVKASVDDPVAQTLKTIVTEEVDRVTRSMRQRTKSRRAVYV